ncbi:S1 family peptidase [Mycobacteroides abscessus subsp. abscessus]|uniref:S1 family peptidase n=1 Tax=Mycobacteroides abscessus TaxID=36809 RepID=UPI001D14C359|nr:S1 family peptidase [Mycobacteroides abscessus]UEA25167.1 S1 family peptidase [Mycobacteroides abscessus subsp. abscessus]
MSKRTRLITAVAAGATAVVMLSGCSTSVAGQPIAETPNVTTAAADASAESPYVSVTVTPPRVGNDGVQYGNLPYPGIAIGQHQADGRTKDCSLGPQVRSGSRVGFLTAGHCDRTPGGEVFVFADPDAKQPVLVGVISDAGVSTAPSPDLDVAILWTNSADPSAARIAGKYPVVGVMPTEQVRRLPAGTPICVDGAWSGVHCSDLISADEKIRYEHGTEGGDSGGPVFVVDREGRATLIGIHRGHDPDMPTVGEATILAAALDHLDVTAVTG